MANKWTPPTYGHDRTFGWKIQRWWKPPWSAAVQASWTTWTCPGNVAGVAVADLGVVVAVVAAEFAAARLEPAMTHPPEGLPVAG